ncbi:WD domain, G-beta repeat-containing protein, partial [Toxoplasma gondii VAND]
ASSASSSSSPSASCGRRNEKDGEKRATSECRFPQPDRGSRQQPRAAAAGASEGGLLPFFLDLSSFSRPLLLSLFTVFVLLTAPHAAQSGASRGGTEERRSPPKEKGSVREEKKIEERPVGVGLAEPETPLLALLYFFLGPSCLPSLLSNAHMSALSSLLCHVQSSLSSSSAPLSACAPSVASSPPSASPQFSSALSRDHPPHPSLLQVDGQRGVPTARQLLVSSVFAALARQPSAGDAGASWSRLFLLWHAVCEQNHHRQRADASSAVHRALLWGGRLPWMVRPSAEQRRSSENQEPSCATSSVAPCSSPSSSFSADASLAPTPSECLWLALGSSTLFGENSEAQQRWKVLVSSFVQHRLLAAERLLEGDRPASQDACASAEGRENANGAVHECCALLLSVGETEEAISALRRCRLFGHALLLSRLYALEEAVVTEDLSRPVAGPSPRGAVSRDARAFSIEERSSEAACDAILLHWTERLLEKRQLLAAALLAVAARERLLAAAILLEPGVCPPEPGPQMADPGRREGRRGESVGSERGASLESREERNREQKGDLEIEKERVLLLLHALRCARVGVSDLLQERDESGAVRRAEQRKTCDFGNDAEREKEAREEERSVHPEDERSGSARCKTAARRVSLMRDVLDGRFPLCRKLLLSRFSVLARPGEEAQPCEPLEAGRDLWTKRSCRDFSSGLEHVSDTALVETLLPLHLRAAATLATAGPQFFASACRILSCSEVPLSARSSPIVPKVMDAASDSPSSALRSDVSVSSSFSSLGLRDGRRHDETLYRCASSEQTGHEEKEGAILLDELLRLTSFAPLLNEFPSKKENSGKDKVIAVVRQSLQGHQAVFVAQWLLACLAGGGRCLAGCLASQESSRFRLDGNSRPQRQLPAVSPRSLHRFLSKWREFRAASPEGCGDFETPAASHRASENTGAGVVAALESFEAAVKLRVSSSSSETSPSPSGGTAVPLDAAERGECEKDERRKQRPPPVSAPEVAEIQLLSIAFQWACILLLHCELPTAPLMLKLPVDMSSASEGGPVHSPNNAQRAEGPCEDEERGDCLSVSLFFKVYADEDTALTSSLDRTRPCWEARVLASELQVLLMKVAYRPFMHEVGGVASLEYAARFLSSLLRLLLLVTAHPLQFPHFHLRPQTDGNPEDFAQEKKGSDEALSCEEVKVETSLEAARVSG